MIRADSLPDAKRTAIVETIRQLKQVVLWKWETESIPNKPKNLHVRKWLPQRDILCHPNVKVFMAHGGLMGLSEGAYCGVPAVITPIYGDQFLNAAAYVHRGAGVVLEYASINSTEVVLEAIRTALRPR
jgi:glucuronosyltransferase